MKKSLLLLTLFSFILGACGGDDNSTPTPTAPPPKLTLLTKSAWIKRSQRFLQPQTVGGQQTLEAYTNVFGADYANIVHRWNSNGTYSYTLGQFNDVYQRFGINYSGRFRFSFDSTTYFETITQGQNNLELPGKDILKLTEDSLVIQTQELFIGTVQGQQRTIPIPVIARFTRQ